jgi:hypothetical protein
MDSTEQVRGNQWRYCDPLLSPPTTILACGVHNCKILPFKLKIVDRTSLSFYLKLNFVSIFLETPFSSAEALTADLSLSGCSSACNSARKRGHGFLCLRFRAPSPAGGGGTDTGTSWGGSRGGVLLERVQRRGLADRHGQLPLRLRQRHPRARAPPALRRDLLRPRHRSLLQRPQSPHPPRFRR